MTDLLTLILKKIEKILCNSIFLLYFHLFFFPLRTRANQTPDANEYVKEKAKRREKNTHRLFLYVNMFFSSLDIDGRINTIKSPVRKRGKEKRQIFIWGIRFKFHSKKHLIFYPYHLDKQEQIAYTYCISRTNVPFVYCYLYRTLRLYRYVLMQKITYFGNGFPNRINEVC